MSNKYSVKEIYYTIQGEGAHSGRPAIFLRFAGCNLWSGLEKDRKDATCQFCDTDFIGTNGENGGKYSSDDLCQKVASLWPQKIGQPYVVCTGGEPLLQLKEELILKLQSEGFHVAVETNGTQNAPLCLDWICVSPKAGAAFVQNSGDELKLVFPQVGLEPKTFEDCSFSHFYLQPMDNARQSENTQLAIQYCLSNPKWKMSLQTHKLMGIP